MTLGVFAVFYGLDWIAVGHLFGTAVAAFGAGLIREEVGSYTPAFLASGVLALVASVVVVSLALRRPGDAATAKSVSA